MTHEQQSKLLGEFYAEKKNVMKLKGEDYANEDVLSNFKSAGANIGISAELQCLSLIATKVARLGNLLSGKTPNNESVSDSILDLSNYTDLLYCLVNEGEKPKQKAILKEMMAQDEKDGLYEQITDEVNKPKTKRWENVEPFNPPSSGLRPMNEHDEIIFNQELAHEMEKVSQLVKEYNISECECDCTEPIEYKPTPEPNEPIKEPYEPKVGDRFKNNVGAIWEVILVEKLYCILLYDNDGDMSQFCVSHKELNLDIEKGILKKIN